MFVRYIGTATVRTITAQQWAEVGVKDQRTVSWGRLNQYAVPYSSLSDDAIAVLMNDPAMIQVESYWDPEEQFQARVASAVRRLRARAANAAAAT